ncbi:6095_t:CDS:1, partial [Ambispora leptoticha]
MSELSTETKPFNGYRFDTELALKIIDGLRPEFTDIVPDCFIKLAKQCMSPIPQERPTAE